MARKPQLPQVNQTLAQPIPAQRTLRRDELRVLTSGDAGKILPLAYVPLLREDAVQRGQLRISVQMQETAETILNGIHCNAYVHFIPFLAFERFNGMDALNRSYMGEPEREGESPIPFVHSAPFGAHGSNEIYKCLGLHADPATPVNTAVLEAYNCLVNFRRRERSQSLPQRGLYTTTLARAMWHHTHMRHLVPDFDQARLEGEVPLTVTAARLPVSGLAVATTGTPTADMTSIAWSGNTPNPTGLRMGSAQMGIAVQATTEIPQVFAELQDNGITVSLANIEMAKKTAAFARMRERYQGYDDDFLVDLLMQGVRVPEAAMSQPILLAHRHNLMGYAKRYATDAANLDQSVTVGETSLDLTFRTPPMNTGGVILVTVEITPEQLFERHKDYFLHAGTAGDFPNFLRDYLDPEKVSVVSNDHVDVDHSDPSGLFGYAPLNHQWQRTGPRIGGKFYRPTVDASFDEDRQRIWSLEVADPDLTEDFWLVTGLHKKIFADTVADSFELLATGGAVISGLTVFGAGLTEATDDYDAVMAKVDQTRIEKPATPAT
jgi:hypothetical protein